jgi:hypothetical protein
MSVARKCCLCPVHADATGEWPELGSCRDCDARLFLSIPVAMGLAPILAFALYGLWETIGWVL